MPSGSDSGSRCALAAVLVRDIGSNAVTQPATRLCVPCDRDLTPASVIVRSRTCDGPGRAGQIERIVEGSPPRSPAALRDWLLAPQGDRPRRSVTGNPAKLQPS